LTSFQVEPSTLRKSTHRVVNNPAVTTAEYGSSGNVNVSGIRQSSTRWICHFTKEGRGKAVLLMTGLNWQPVKLYGYYVWRT